MLCVLWGMFCMNVACSTCRWCLWSLKAFLAFTWLWPVVHVWRRVHFAVHRDTILDKLFLTSELECMWRLLMLVSMSMRSSAVELSNTHFTAVNMKWLDNWSSLEMCLKENEKWVSCDRVRSRVHFTCLWWMRVLACFYRASNPWVNA